MTVIPFNNRLLIKEIKETDKKIGDIIVPNFVKDRKDVPKFMMIQILEVSAGISPTLVGKKAVIETGFLEEVTIDNVMHHFCPFNYLVCLLQEEQIVSVSNRDIDDYV